MFRNRKLNTSISIKINEEALDTVEDTRILDVLIDDKLTWKNHISLLKSKLSIMYNASVMTDICVLYHPLFLPYIMHCVEVWDNTSATTVECLVLLQKR